MELDEVIDQYQFSAGVIKYCTDEVAEAATNQRAVLVAEQKQQGVNNRRRVATIDDLIEVCGNSGNKAVDALNLHVDYKNTIGVGDYHPEMVVQARLMDSAIYGLEAGLNSIVRIMAPEDPLMESTKELQSQLFPDGARGVVAENYVEKLAQVERITEEMNKAIELVQQLGLGRYFSRLQELLPVYDRFLKMPVEKVPHDAYKTALNVAQKGLLEVISYSLAVYPGNNKKDVAGRAILLAAVREQNEAMAERRRLGTRSEEGPVKGKKGDQPNPAPVVPAQPAPAAVQPVAPVAPAQPVAPVAPVVGPNP